MLLIRISKDLGHLTKWVCCLSVLLIADSPFFESLCSFSLSCFSVPGDSGMSSSMASSDSQACRWTQRHHTHTKHTGTYWISGSLVVLFCIGSLHGCWWCPAGCGTSRWWWPHYLTESAALWPAGSLTGRWTDRHTDLLYRYTSLSLFHENIRNQYDLRKSLRCADSA